MRSLVLPLALFASPLLAQAPAEDASTRLHDAYVLEVIEGKVPEAARLYLALLETDDLEPMVRAQAELRFAACCVVLGRADEARARLAALAVRDDLPAGLRAEVEEYRGGLEGVGAGSALDEKLEQMVFELGRANYALVAAGVQPEPEVYRDFAILGKRGWPTLRRLLDHPDASLQSQAFLLLCRMDAPGMVEAWRPETMETYTGALFSEWLRRHRDERTALEDRLRELPAPALERWLSSYLAKAGFSPAFLGELPERDLDPQTVVSAAFHAGAEGARLIRSWIGDTPLGVRACTTALAIAASDSREGWTRDEERALVLTASQLLARTRPAGSYGGFLAAIGKRYDAGLALEAMERVLDYWESPEFRDSTAADPRAREFVNDLVYGLAGALAGRELDGGEAERLREGINRWIERVPSLGGVVPDLVKEVLRRLEGDAAVAWLTTLYERGDAQQQGKLVRALEPRDPRTPRRVAAILKVCDPTVVHQLMNGLGVMTGENGKITAEFAAAMREVLPGMLLDARGQGGRILWMLPPVLRPLRVEEARAVYLQWVRTLAEAPHANEPDLVGVLLSWLGGVPAGREESYRWMWEEIVAPAVPDLLPVLDPDLRQRLLLGSVQWLALGIGAEEVRERLAQDVMANFPQLGWTLASDMLRLPELFPYEEWVPRLPVVGARSFDHHPLPQEGVAALASHLEEQPEDVHVSLLYLLRRWLPPERMRTLLSTLYMRCGPDKLPELLAISDRATLDPGAAEGALVRFATVDHVDATALGELALLVAELRASDELIPVARRLLGSSEPTAIAHGITLASKLGRTELIEPLVAVLDSPDANLRTAAKDAIESIREWERFRNEVATPPR